MKIKTYCINNMENISENPGIYFVSYVPGINNIDKKNRKYQITKIYEGLEKIDKSWVSKPKTHTIKENFNFKSIKEFLERNRKANEKKEHDENLEYIKVFSKICESFPLYLYIGESDNLKSRLNHSHDSINKCKEQFEEDNKLRIKCVTDNKLEDEKFRTSLERYLIWLYKPKFNKEYNQ